MNVKKVISLFIIAIAIVIVFGSIYFICDKSTSELIKDSGDRNNEVNNLEEKPGFEAVFAIAGLLAIVYLVLRQKE